MKCEVCRVDLAAEKCIFATQKRVIEGKEHVFCCVHCADTFERKKAEAKTRKRSKK